MACGPPQVAASEPHGAAGELASAIIGGREAGASEAFPAAGALLAIVRGRARPGSEAPVTLCGATLVAQRVVLTAAHCLAPLAGGGRGTVRLFFTTERAPGRWAAADVASSTQAAEVVEARLHPRFRDPEGPELMGLGQAHDLGLGRLVRAIDGVAPQALAAGEHVHALRLGLAVDIVGDGRPDAGGASSAAAPGVRRVARAAIAALGPFEMQIGGGEGAARRALGDSGGPTLFLPPGARPGGEVLIGVGTHVYQAAPGEHGQVDTRIDRYRHWIGGVLADWAAP